MSQIRWRNFDWLPLIAVLLLCGIGVGMIYSATITTIDLANYWSRQVIFIDRVGDALSRRRHRLSQL
ncbi:MAG: hypothetical protein R2838_04555 [Caldilineaceae bacterium]